MDIKVREQGHNQLHVYVHSLIIKICELYFLVLLLDPTYDGHSKAQELLEYPVKKCLKSWSNCNKLTLLVLNVQNQEETGFKI